LSDASRKTPLQGIQVLEIGQVISAPYAGLLLADLGAEVVKIEPPEVGDSARNPDVSGLRGKSATFLTLNRNKRSVCLNLTDPGDYAHFTELVSRADVVLSNMVPRTAARLGADPASLRAMNPRIISCRVIGFRSDQPQVDDPSFDLTHQALAGYLTMGGHEGSAPSRVAIPLADLAVAMFSAYAILAALMNRERTGLGEDIEVPMFDSLLSLLTYSGTLFLNQGEVPARLGSAHPHTAPWQAFDAADGPFVIAVRNEKFWGRLCVALDRPDLAADPRFALNEGRVLHRAELQDELEKMFLTDTADHWLAALRAGGVPASPVQSIAEALTGELAIGSPLIQTFVDPDLGPLQFVGNPVRFSRMQMADPVAAPALGQDGPALLGSAQDAETTETTDETDREQPTEQR
jgi:crotonobetainyl-CoA:carnitine CoA-transferase CaiB-like acyl-CoA transferase